MNSLRSVLRRLGLFLFRDRATRDLEDEMRLHRELRAAALGGPAAATDARRQFGNALQHVEASRDAWGLAWLDDLRQDVRYAVRRLRQRPAFSASVIVVLALGIGATTAMFSAVDAAMLRPLPFPHAEELVVLPSVGMARDRARTPDRIPDLLDMTAMHDVFSHVAAYASGGLNLADPANPVRLQVGVVTGDLFNTLGVAPMRGRGFVAADGVPGAPLVAVLSYSLWQQRFGGSDAMGRELTLNGHEYQVVGVMPRGFSFPERRDLWIPMSVPITSATFEAAGMVLNSTVIGRLGDGVSRATAAQHLLLRWNQALAVASGARQSNIKFYLDGFRRRGPTQELRQVLVGPRRSALLFLFGATGLLLLIACANTVNLLLSQVTLRSREVALRAVLGATRSRVIRQLLAESVLLAMIGAIAGLCLARPALRLVSSLLPAGLTTVAPPALDMRVMLFATAIATLTGIAAGVLPALRASRSDPATTIKAGSQGTPRRANLVRLSLVAGEVALTSLLLIGTGLMLRSLNEVLNVDVGVNVDHAASAEIAFPAATPAATRVERMTAITQWLRAQPGISEAGFVNELPIVGGGILMDFTPGQPLVLKRDDDPGAQWLMASPGYFAATGIPLLHGRGFTEHDDSTAPAVAIISQSIAERYWPGVDAVGRTVALSGGAPATIVGVVANVTAANDVTGDPGPQLYFPILNDPPREVALVVRGTISRDALLRRITAAVHQADPAQALSDLRMLDDVLSDAVTPWRTNALLTGIFGALALALASFGIYAVVAQSVSQRAREFGIRSALGASGGELLGLVSREMVWVAGIGVVIGLVGAWMLAHLAASLLYGVTVHDPMTFIAVPLVLLVPAALATLIPASRATRVNPADVMRAE